MGRRLKELSNNRQPGAKGVMELSQLASLQDFTSKINIEHEGQTAGHLALAQL